MKNEETFLTFLRVEKTLCYFTLLLQNMEPSDLPRKVKNDELDAYGGAKQILPKDLNR